MRYPSNYEILRAILTKLGGNGEKRFDSCYSILLEILDNIGGGGSKKITVDIDGEIQDGELDMTAELNNGVLNIIQ